MAAAREGGEAGHLTEAQWAQRVLIAVVIVAVSAVLLMVVSLASEVLLAAFGGVLLAVGLRYPAAWISRRSGASPAASLFLFCALLLVTLAAAFWLLGAQLVEQMGQLSDQLPQVLQRLREQAEQYRWARWVLARAPDAVQQVQPSRTQMIGAITGAASTTVVVVGGVALVVFVGLFLAVNPRLYVEGVLQLFPRQRRPRVRQIMEEMTHLLGGWLVARAVSMTVVGVMTWLGLWLLGVPMPLALGVIAGLLAFIPNVGPVASAIPAVLLGMVQSPMLGVWVVALYLGVQAIESYLITPNVEKRVIDLPPALILVSQVLFLLAFGFLGLLFASPLTAILLMLVNRVYVEDVLGDRSDGAGNGLEH